MVADTCPHRGNEGWCPRYQGQGNKFGVKHHFDFTNPCLVVGNAIETIGNRWK